MTLRPSNFAAWRDIDNNRPQIGARIWRTGCEFHVGRRLYRVRWSA
jgi:hypothetical protein